ncbi:MAG TPA: hypothetical protein DCS93_12350 [Microscillaceae bacterium]|nr:hypothetical protein [Microscillaceae bacterium]
MAVTQQEISKRQTTIAATEDPQEKAALMIDLGLDMLYGGEIENAQKLLANAEKICEKIGFQDGFGRIYLGRAAINYFNADYTTSTTLANQAIEIFLKTGNKEDLAETYTNLGMAHWSQGDYSIALDYTFKGLQLYQEAEAEGRISYAVYLLGGYYLDLKDSDNAEKYFSQAYEMSSREGAPPFSLARSCIGLANVALQRKQLNKALDYLTKAEKIQTEGGEYFGLSRTYNDLGKVYRRLNEADKALEYYGKSLDIRLQANDKQALVTTYLDLGEFNIEQDQLELALNYLQNGLKWAEKLNARVKIYRAHLLLSQVYESIQDFDKAFHHLKQHNDFKEQVIGKDANLRIRNLETQMAKERSEKEAEIYRLRNVELKKLYEEIEQQNEEITSSIEYARRIQDAMLPLDESIEVYRDYAFILYQPRDIVSGDFYWIYSRPSPEDPSKKLVFTAAVDCTGHGVPGAFMSMIGKDLLDNIIIAQGTIAPSDILHQMDMGVRKALNQDQTDNQDGMDLAITVVDEANECVYFAGANNPLVYFQHNQMHYIKGSKFGIGGGKYTQNKVFEQHAIQIDTCTELYIFSDGYQDQFGGPNNKKFMKPRFRNLLVDIHNLPMHEQYAILENTLVNWMGDESQVDDILVMGIRLGALEESQG